MYTKLAVLAVLASYAARAKELRKTRRPPADTEPARSELGKASPADDQPSCEHQRPDGVDTLTVEAVGLLTEALERTERARGHLYAFHQLTGGADFKVGDAVTALHEAGHDEIADWIATELVGRNVIRDRWTFQIVEDYDDSYWFPFREMEREVRERLTTGRRHLHEAELKEARRTHGHPDHTARPPGVTPWSARAGDSHGRDENGTPRRWSYPAPAGQPRQEQP